MATATATAPTASAEDYKNEYGSALYLEFRKEEKTTQFIITPETTHPDNGVVIPTLLLTRMTSSDHPRRQWAYKVPKIEVVLSKTPDEAERMAYALHTAETLAVYLKSMALGDWTLFQTPLMVDLGPDDLRALDTKVTQPDSLMRRMLRVRDEAGFPTSLYNDSTSTRY